MSDSNYQRQSYQERARYQIYSRWTGPVCCMGCHVNWWKRVRVLNLGQQVRGSEELKGHWHWHWEYVCPSCAVRAFNGLPEGYRAHEVKQGSLIYVDSVKCTPNPKEDFYRRFMGDWGPQCAVL